MTDWPEVKGTAITLGISTSRMKALRKELSAVLPGTAEQRDTFLHLAAEEVDVYWKVLLPAEVSGSRDRRLEQVAKAGRSFAKALNDLHDDDRALLKQIDWWLNGKQGDLAQWQMDFDEASDLASGTSKAAERLLAKQRSGTSTGGRPVGGAVSSLIEQIGHYYAMSFGERPSATVKGPFAVAIKEILDAADIKEDVGEKRLAGIVRRADIGAPPPRRGPKVRSR